uniref:Uncharacterized protein n=1 Tax=Setaria digitata TaxID=48799 RepID=A0A915PKJ9_9BILA
MKCGKQHQKSNKNLHSLAVNNDCLEEQTTAAEIGTTSTQMTSTVTSTQSRLNLNPNLNSSHLASKSNSTVELATDNEKGPIKLESNAGDRTEKKSWNARWCCPRCSGERVQNSVKRKGNDKSCLEKELIGDYKLLESVATMVQKYEEKSRLESEQDTCNF